MSGCIPLVTLRAVSDVDLTSLNAVEVARASRLRHADDRQRSMAARALLRQAVARVSGMPAAHVVVEAGPEGEPTIIGSDLRVSVTHSGGYVAVAVHTHAVGIDLEEITPEVATDTLLDRICTPAERTWLATGPNNSGFHRLWVRKEAVAKSFSMLLSVERLDVISDVVQGREVRDLEVAPGYAGAVSWMTSAKLGYGAVDRSVLLADGRRAGVIAAGAVADRSPEVHRDRIMKFFPREDETATTAEVLATLAL